MKREILEQYLGKNVKITLFDRTTYEGELHKTGEELFKNEPNLYIPTNRYFCISLQLPVSFVFRCSHVIKIKMVYN